jgi:murein DD-endopeptidase MepM/ murein hydrolase activator NlpD
VVLLCAGVVAVPSRAAGLQRVEAIRDALPRLVDHGIGRGECFAGILAAHGVPGAEAARWLDAALPQVDLRRIEAGRTLHLQFDGAALSGLRYEVARGRTLVAERGAAGDLVARLERHPITVRPLGMRLTVRSGFFEATRRAGVPDAIISQIVDLLSWKISFETDVHRGDHLRVLYEERVGSDGQRLAPGRVLAVDYRGRSALVAAYLYAVDDGEPVYVDDEGHLLDAAPLRFPLEFARITSTSSDARMHPILKRERAHHGVDFAAPLGTPVRAVGAGTVRFAGAQGGFGNHVEVDHGAGFVSAYSHLSAIAPKLRVSGPVRRGQLLGWVGQTGLATGPHLHFAIFADGAYVDPLTLKLPPQPLGVDQRRFGVVRSELLARLRAIPRPAPAAPNTPEIGLSPFVQAGRVGPIMLTF